MKQYLEIFQYINQSNESVIIDYLDSPDIENAASRLTNLVQPCIEEIMESATKVKSSVEDCLKELKKTEELLQHYRQNTKKTSPFEIFEEIGRLTGFSFQIFQLLKTEKEDIIKMSKEFWQQEFEQLKNQWFFDKNCNFKKGLGWSEKESFIQSIKLINSKHINFTRNICKTSLQLIYDQIKLFWSTDKLSFYSQLLDVEQANIYQKKIDLLFDKIIPPTWITEFDQFSTDTYSKSKSDKLSSNTYSKPNSTLDPIFNCIWGDLPWELVNKTQADYLQKLEREIDDLFDKKAKVITIFFDVLMQLHNDVLSKQEFYQRETSEEQVARQIWLDTQREKLLTIQSLLENTLNFTADR